MDELIDIGGSFSIRVLSRFLQEDPETGRPREGEAQYHALRALLGFAVDPRYPPDVARENYSDELERWREWLDKNRNSVSTLEPVGEGIAVNEKLCRRLMKNDLAATLEP